MHTFEELLQGYYDAEIIEWLRYGFPISRDLDAPDPIPADINHKGATRYPEHIDRCLEKEIANKAIISPFAIPPFIRRIGISPISTREKRDSENRHVILDKQL